ncbi:VOC family protein [Sphingomonas crusticola]|uniref:VOC family protein n=1 Tax=Sphingomonas crusticola TaxID=1697973 RepID=UPI000E24D40F|nr:VOC family protein [Sphingomonas crusticola]
MAHPANVPNGIPNRLHHHAWVVEDQERTRHFYEDIIGMPLLATWVERTEFQGTDLIYSHTFYGMKDGGALAFFSFADPEVYKRFAAKKQEMFIHISLEVDQETQDAIQKRCADAGLGGWSYDHGYCKSVYVTDPDGLLVEFTVDPPNLDEINRVQADTAHASLAAWMAGDYTPTNFLRHETHYS